MSTGKTAKRSALVAFAKQTSTKEILLYLPIDDVVSKAQTRKRFRNIPELASTIEKSGQQSPIHVAPKNEDGKYVILRGERRWRACKHLGLDEIKAIIDRSEYTDSSMLIAELVENVQRDDLTVLEVAEAIGKLTHEQKMTGRQISEELGKSDAYVTKHLTIAESLTETAKNLYHKYEMGVETLYQLSQAAKINEESVAKLCALAEAEGRGVSREESRNLLQTLKQHRGGDDDSETDIVEDQQEKEDDAQDINDEEPAAKQAAPASSSQKNTLSAIVSVMIDGAYQTGILVLSKKPKEEGHAYVQFEGGTLLDFPVHDIKLLSVG